jgi:hypothetical protein
MLGRGLRAKHYLNRLSIEQRAVAGERLASWRREVAPWAGLG